MSQYGTSDLPDMMADFGVPVVFGAVQGLGIVDQVDRDLLQDQSVQFTGREVTVTLETSKFAALKSGNALTVDGVSHLVLQVRRVGDGALLEAMCRPS